MSDIVVGDVVVVVVVVSGVCNGGLWEKNFYRSDLGAVAVIFLVVVVDAVAGEAVGKKFVMLDRPLVIAVVVIVVIATSIFLFFVAVVGVGVFFGSYCCSAQ